MVARRAPAAAVAARNLVDEHGGQYFKAADAARIKNNVVRGLGAACGRRADLLRAIPSEDDHVFSKTPGETTKTPGDTLAKFLQGRQGCVQHPTRLRGSKSLVW